MVTRSNLSALNDYEIETLVRLMRKAMHILEVEQHSSDPDTAALAAWERRKAVDILEVINPKQVH